MRVNALQYTHAHMRMRTVSIMPSCPVRVLQPHHMQRILVPAHLWLSSPWFHVAYIRVHECEEEDDTYHTEERET